MSDSKSTSTGGGLGLSGLIGGITAWCTTPSFVGWAGVGKALLVGAGTSMGVTIVGVPVALACAAVLGLGGLAIGGKKAGIILALTGGVLGGLGGGVYGGVEGYHFSKDALTQTTTLTDKDAKISFNGAAEKAKKTILSAKMALKVQAPSLG